MDGSKKFIYNLKLLVDDHETDDIISWNTVGDCICIYDKIKLSEILPRYFRSKNFTSFNRQLNLYGFRKLNVRKHDNVLFYRHKYFMKDYPHKLPNVRRQGERKSLICVETQTDNSSRSNEVIINNNALRIEMLENEVDNLKAEVHELRASFSSVQVKLANQQNLFSAAFRAMNKNPMKHSDLRFNVFIKPNYQSIESSGSSSNDGLYPSTNQSPNKGLLKLTSDQFQSIESNASNNNDGLYSSTNQSANKSLRKLINDQSESRDSNTQTIKQTYDVISNNLLNNPNFFQNYPIYVPSVDEDEDPSIDDQDCNFDSSYLKDLFNNFTDNYSLTDVD